MKSTKNIKYILFLLIGFIIINFFSSIFFKRFDLTKDNRFTLSPITHKLLNNLNTPLLINVYLEGDFPPEFSKLQVETKHFLEELKAANNLVSYRFINPKNIAEKLIKEGLKPSKLTIQEQGKISETIIFPWATMSYKSKEISVSLLKNTNNYNTQNQLQESIENLEYELTSALKTIATKKKKKIAIIKGNGELQDIYIYSFLKQLGRFYNLAPFTLDSVKTRPLKTLQELKSYDLAIIAKPTIKFTEAEKYTLDQFIISGGKTIWLIDEVQADMDSLKQNGSMLAYPKTLNLTDLLFNYGIRINPDLVQDLYSSKIKLATGNIGNKPQFEEFNWNYFPLIQANNKSIITTNINPVNLQFVSSLDTLKNNILKIPLLESSLLSKIVATPRLISLNELNNQNSESYNQGNKLLGVLLKGNFTSAYKNRIKPFFNPNFEEKGNANKMIVIGDGDIIANQVSNGKPLTLGFDKWTNTFYGNQAFLLNCTNYLLDDTDIIKLRTKSIKIPYLDTSKLNKSMAFWQWLNIGLPILLLFLFGFVFNWLRRKKYTH